MEKNLQLQYFLPAAGTLYFTLASIWEPPYGEQVVGTITAVDTFFGVVLGISSSQYNKIADSRSRRLIIEKYRNGAERVCKTCMLLLRCFLIQY